MLIDCHSHSEFSFDAKFPVRDMVLAARQKGIGVLAVTDHCELNHWEDQHVADTLPQSVASIEGEKPEAGLTLLTGIELGQPLQSPSRAKEVLAGYRFDMVIGSVHNTAGDPDFFSMNFLKLSDDDIFYLLKKYYRELLETARWNGFDTLAHITYPYRYLNAARKEREILVRPESFDLDADEVFETLIANQKALELNSSSFMRGGADLELNIRYFKRYRELGGELVTVGSDAHEPANVGYGIKEAYRLLKEAGFTHVTYFEDRKPVLVKLSEI